MALRYYSVKGKIHRDWFMLLLEAELNKKVNQLVGLFVRFGLLVTLLGLCKSMYAETSFEHSLINIPSFGADGSQARIAQGQDLSNPADAPWMASLHNVYNEAFCGAVLIDSQHLLTASHCVAHLLPNEFSIVFGQYLYSSERHQVERTWVPVGFRWSHLSEDIAVITLKEPVNIEPLAIADASSIDHLNTGDPLQILGFGQMADSGNLSPTLKQGTVPFVKTDTCSYYWQEEYPSLAAMIGVESLCASGFGFETDTCLGDSGGPLLLYDQTWKLLGLTSFGEATCGGADKPSVYVRPTAFAGPIEKAVHGEAYSANWTQTLVGDDPALSQQTLILENTSDDVWQLGELAFDSTSIFQFVGGSCFNSILQPGSTCTVDLQFSPKSGGFVAQRFLLPRQGQSPIWIDLQGFGYEFIDEAVFGAAALFGFAGGEFMPSVSESSGYLNSAHISWQGMQPLETSELYIGGDKAQDVTLLLDYTPVEANQMPLIYIETLNQYGQKEKFEIDNLQGWQHKTISLASGDYIHVNVQARGHGVEGKIKLDIAVDEPATTDIQSDSLDNSSENNVQVDSQPKEVQLEAGGGLGHISLLSLLGLSVLRRVTARFHT